jgi:hypothetical protein
MMHIRHLEQHTGWFSLLLMVKAHKRKRTTEAKLVFPIVVLKDSFLKIFSKRFLRRWLSGQAFSKPIVYIWNCNQNFFFLILLLAAKKEEPNNL